MTDSARAALTVKLPTTASARSTAPATPTYFRFEAKAGDQIGVQVTSAELGSKLDPVLVLTDANGAGAGRGD